MIKVMEYDLSNFRNKEEAEFVAKNYKTRLEKFEPPFKLEIRADEYTFNSKFYGEVHIINLNGKYWIFNYQEEYDCINSTFDTYQEAIDYAIKLFNGEEIE